LSIRSPTLNDPPDRGLRQAASAASVTGATREPGGICVI